MRKFVFVLAVLLAFAIPAYAANETLDNSGVVEMVHLGLSNQVIEAKIHSSPTNFDTSPKALATLKHEHVPSDIITAMVEAGSAPTATAATGAAPGNATFSMVGVDGAKVAMSPARVTAEFSARKAWIPFYAGGPETFLFIDGWHASLHTNSQPSFITNLNPVNVRLVHMGEKKDRDARYVVFSGSTTDREVPVTTSEVGNGSWRVQPSTSLQAGEEYAFLVYANMPGGCAFWACFAQYAGSSEAFDFGVQ